MYKLMYTAWDVQFPLPYPLTLILLRGQFPAYTKPRRQSTVRNALRISSSQ